MSTARKLAVAAASVSLGWGAMENQVAQAATITGPTTWNLSFSSEGEQVGNGQFSIEREPFEGTIAVYSTPAPGVPENRQEEFRKVGVLDSSDQVESIIDSVSVDTSDNFHQLTSFSANIAGRSWDLSNSNIGGEPFLFFVPPTTGIKSVEVPEAYRNTPLPDNQTIPAGAASIRLVRNVEQGTYWNFGPEPVAGIISDVPRLSIENGGTYQQSGETSELGNISVSGTWEAERVPEPSTTAGTLLAGSTLGAWRLRKRKAQQN